MKTYPTRLFRIFLGCMTLLAVACGGSDGGTSDDGPDEGDISESNSDPSPDVEGEGVVVLGNDSGLRFGPVNDAFAIVLEDIPTKTRGLEIIFTEDTTVRNVCNDPDDTWIDGFSAIVALFLVDFDKGGDEAFAKPTSGNSPGVYGSWPENIEPGMGLLAVASMGLYEDDDLLGGSAGDPAVQNRVTIASADLTEDGHVEGDLSVMVVDGAGDELGLLEVDFNVPFACEIEGDLF